MSTTAAPIPVTRPWMDERESDAARRVIQSGWVTQGPEVAAFEREFGAAVGAPHACAVSSGTAALHLALVALGLGPGDEVVTVSHSFIATGNAIRYCGATPVFVDVQRDTYNIDPDRIAEAISGRSKAILCVHQLGMPCDLASLFSIARSHRLPLVEDAACAAGSEILCGDRWERVGHPQGDIACFSFHPRKLLSTGEGGMLTTANPDLDAKVRLLRHQGMSVSDAVRHTSACVLADSYALLGYNYRLTDIQAAIGREQLARLPLMVSRRRELVARYRQLLANRPGLTLPHEPAWARSNWQSFAIRLDPRIDRQAVMQHMLDEGVATRRGVMSAHLEEAYPAGTWRTTPAGLRTSEDLSATALVLPLYHQMTAHDQDRVVAALGRACGW